MSHVADDGTLDLRVVALGGGHGLAASLAALRHVVSDLTAVVTVADNGGSSGRLRREFGVLPPGDLRQALAALCGDDDWGRTWARVLQHRFASDGEMDNHAVGNLLIVTLWQLLGEQVGPTGGPPPGLTGREAQVLERLARAMTTRAIAEDLYLSPNSIKTYVRTTYRKIGAASRSQAVSWAIRHGFPIGEDQRH